LKTRRRSGEEEEEREGDEKEDEELNVKEKEGEEVSGSLVSEHAVERTDVGGGRRECISISFQ